MIRVAGIALGCLLGLASFAVAQTANLEALEEQAFKQAIAVVAPSMVRIETVGGLDRVGQLLTGTGPTTGVVVSPDGYIISSAFNFVSKPASILVTLPDGRKLTAEQVASDKAKMLTLLKIDARDLIPANPAPADSFKVGQWSLALGRTFGDAPSVSIGIVSALQRIWGKAIQTDAKISPVNYGGPLVDVEGRVLGILVPLSPQATGEVAGVEWYDGGIGFAIPLVDVYASLDRLKTGTDLVPGLLGITLRGQNLYEGAPTIDRVRYGSPAQQAGVRVEDVIVAVDGKPVERQAQVKHVLGNKYAGDKVSLTVKRGDERLTQEMLLVGELIPYESAFLGILPERVATGAEQPPGVEIRYVYANSPAAKAQLQAEERLLQWNETVLTDAASLADAIGRARPADKVKLTVRKGEAERTVEVELGTLPETVPEDLRRKFIFPVDQEGLAAEFPKTGRFSETLAAHEHDYWAYVPDDYNPAYKYALVVWIHAGGDTMEAALAKGWKLNCDQRGIIMIGPKAAKIAGWETSEEEFVHDLVEQFVAKYSIDRTRVVLHSFSNGGPFAYQVAFKYRELFRGVAVAGAPLQVPPPDNEPDFRLQWYLLTGAKSPVAAVVEATAAALRKLKYPVIFEKIDGAGQEYLPQAQLDRLVLWIDSLDRI